MSPNDLYTVGHSTDSEAAFIQLLLRCGIEAVCDVRSSPYSAFNPQFNRESLERSLSEAGIRYVYLGDSLGGRGVSESDYVGDRASYQRISASNRFRLGINRLREVIGESHVALMCAEKDPMDCHRAILVTRNLRMEPFRIQHIHFDGSLETNADFERRLLAKHQLPERDLFLSDDDVIELAYEKQASRISYKRTKPSSDRAGNDLRHDP